MTIIAACMMAFSGGMNLFLSLYGYLYINDVYYPINDINRFTAGIFGIFAFILGLASGRAALRRKHLTLSIIGMCFIMISVPLTVLETVASVLAHYGKLSIEGTLMFCVPQIVLAVLSLILVALSRHEFS
jgi:hypothetical protein